MHLTCTYIRAEGVKNHNNYIGRERERGFKTTVQPTSKHRCEESGYHTTSIDGKVEERKKPSQKITLCVCVCVCVCALCMNTVHIEMTSQPLDTNIYRNVGTKILVHRQCTAGETYSTVYGLLLSCHVTVETMLSSMHSQYVPVLL